ncbi:MAG: ArsR/SmtB family transcription factor [Pseudomonadota bacterium]
MPPEAATRAFAALGQEHRLAVFRMLMAEGPSGLAAGEIAQRLGVPASSLSSHLATLERAGLLRSWRVQRNIFYAVDTEGTRELITFLTHDCCGGRPELCGWDGVEPSGCASASDVSATGS